MLWELLAAGVAVALMQSGHTPQSAARTIGRIAGRAAGSVRRLRSEVSRMQQRAEAAGGADLKASNADLARKLQQLRMVQAETSALLRVRPATILTSDGRVTQAGTSEFSDEELYDALRSEMAEKRGMSSSSLHMAPQLNSRQNVGAFVNSPSTFETGSEAGLGQAANGVGKLGGASGVRVTPSMFQAGASSVGAGSVGANVLPLRGAAMMADLLHWENEALQQQQQVPPHERYKLQ